MVEAITGNEKVNRIAAKNAPSRADSPHAHRASAGPRQRTHGVQPVPSAKRTSRWPFSTFAIQLSAFAAVVRCRVAVKPLVSDRKQRFNLPRKQKNEFYETNPKIPLADPKNADPPRKTNPNKPTANRQRMLRAPSPLEARHGVMCDAAVSGTTHNHISKQSHLRPISSKKSSGAND
jgi:hypothetical protein